MPIHDHYEALSNPMTGPSIGLFDVIPNDSADLPTLPRYFMVTTDGVLAVTNMDGTSGITAPLIAGGVYPMRVRRVLATGTTATGIKAHY